MFESDPYIYNHYPISIGCLSCILKYWVSVDMGSTPVMFDQGPTEGFFSCQWSLSSRFGRQCDIYIHILFVNVNIRNVNRTRATAPISTVNSCSWNSWTYMKWKIVPPRSGLEPTTLDNMPSALSTDLWKYDTFQFMLWVTGSGDKDILFVKFNIWNTNRAWAPFRLWTIVPWCDEIWLSNFFACHYTRITEIK